MGMPAARLTDMHLCVVPAPPPAPPLPVPVPNPIMIIIGPQNVLIGKLPAARVGDMAATGVPHPIIKGSGNVMICKMPAARMGDTFGPPCSGPISLPCMPNVLIGG